MSVKRSHARPLAVIASEDADYERLGLSRGAVAPWEDGARTDNRPGTYEWWYFDARLDDGSSLVVVFMNKDLATPNEPLTPTIRLNLDLADGRSYEKIVTYAPESWEASSSETDVRMGENRGYSHSSRGSTAPTSGSPGPSPSSITAAPLSSTSAAARRSGSSCTSGTRELDAGSVAFLGAPRRLGRR